MKIKYPNTSPYSITPQSSDFIGIYKHRNIPANAGDQLITISTKYQYRPDLLSFDLYGTPDFWWIFCVRNPNKIRDSIWDFVIGTDIIVPSDQHLRSVIG